MRTFVGEQRERQKERQRERRQALKANGLCQDCGQTKAEHARTMCGRCLENRRRGSAGIPRIKSKFRPHLFTLPGKPPHEDQDRIARMVELAERCA